MMPYWTIRLLCLAALLLVPSTPREEIAREVHQRVNAYRTTHRKSTLAARNALHALAQEHSEGMASGRIPFSHQGFEGRARRARKALPGTGLIAENVYMTATPGSSRIAAEAVTAWINSPGHQKNMVGNFIYTGIGVAQSPDGYWYVTQLFAGKM